MAIAGLAVAAARGIDVPDQLSITGYDDTELAAHVQPPLTTVCSDVIGWGRAAARRLLELIDERPATGVEPRRRRGLVVRGSTGPAPVRAQTHQQSATELTVPSAEPNGETHESEGRHRHPDHAGPGGHRRLRR